METAVKDQVRRLIKSMTKSEKRNFKLYANRVGSSASRKFVQLFDLIDAQDEPDDQVLLSKIADGKPGKLSNLKRHLYQQVLVSLRLVHISKQTDIEIRQQIDFARILYGKGHYLDALRLLERIKTTAQDNNYDLLLLEILEFQKLIEARHVTRSRQMTNKMDQLVRDSMQQSEINLHTSLQSSINIQIQGYYILNGHATDDKQKAAFTYFWDTTRSKALGYPNAPNTFFERINRYQASMWRHYILLDLDNALNTALECYNLFTLESEMPLHDPDLYMRVLYYVNAYAFLKGSEKELERSSQRITQFVEQRGSTFNDNSHHIAFTYEQLCQLNVYLHHQKWEAADQLAKEIEENRTEEFSNLPDHRQYLLRYKFASIKFALGQYDAALAQINSIINSKINLLREELLINTRLLQILCYFEAEDFYLADYAVTNLSRMARRSDHTTQVHLTTLASLRRLLRDSGDNQEKVFADLQSEVENLQRNPAEAKSLKFLDILGWINHR